MFDFSAHAANNILRLMKDRKLKKSCPFLCFIFLVDSFFQPRSSLITRYSEGPNALIVPLGPYEGSSQIPFCKKIPF
jgi:hypothetical protein